MIHRTTEAPDSGAVTPALEDDAPHWAVCRAFSNRVHWLRPEIEKTNHGTFMPTYVRVWSSDGKLSIRERALMPGYLFFMTKPKLWGEVKNVEGVYDVLTNNGKASKVTPDEMQRMVLGHILGTANEVDLAGLERQRVRQNAKRDRARRSRPSKRARAAA
ncbi:transcription antitermination factor NusG [Bradyrhizobium sp. AZCC 1578]|uniref:transcription termination/antitermination protein NusG n=1 Tax=Bradyrhizobium sp. AZCC 1578 TaxID=3117027 RepID=UPI002FF3F7F0